MSIGEIVDLIQFKRSETLSRLFFCGDESGTRFNCQPKPLARSFDRNDRKDRDVLEEIVAFYLLLGSWEAIFQNNVQDAEVALAAAYAAADAAHKAATSDDTEDALDCALTAFDCAEYYEHIRSEMLLGLWHILLNDFSLLHNVPQGDITKEQLDAHIEQCAA